MEISSSEVVCVVLDYPTGAKLWNSEDVGRNLGRNRYYSPTVQIDQFKDIYRVRQNNKGWRRD